MSWIVDSAQVATAAFTAGAAYAALRSVKQGQEIWHASRVADIHVQVLHNVTTGTNDLIVINAGGGLARGVAFAIGSETTKAFGVISDGFVGPSQKVEIQTQVPQSDKTQCLVMFRDVDESPWVIGRVGPKKSIRPPTPLSSLWDHAYPQLPWADLRTVGYDVTFSSLGTSLGTRPRP